MPSQQQPQNSFVNTDHPRAEKLIRTTPQQMVQFARPHLLNAAPVGQSFYDNIRPNQHVFNQHEPPKQRPVTTTHRPLIHKFATLYPPSAPTATEPTTTVTSYETTTRQTTEPNNDNNNSDETPTSTPYDGDDSTTTTEQTNYGKYTFEENPFYEKYTSGEQSGEEFDDKPYFKEFTLDGSPFGNSSTESEEEDEDDDDSTKKQSSYFVGRDKPQSSRLVATTTPSTTTTRKPSYYGNKYSNSKRRPTAGRTTKAPEYEDQEQDYTFHEIKTFSDTFDSKPGKIYNKFSQVKVIRKDKAPASTTARPTYKKNSSKHFKVSPVAASTARPKKNSTKKSDKLKTVKKIDSRGKIKYLYDEEVYHPDESRVISTVYSRDGRIIKQDLDQSPSYQQFGYQPPFPHRAQLDAITTAATLFRYSQQRSQAARLSDVELVRPTTVRTVSKQPPPMEMRYFQ